MSKRPPSSNWPNVPLSGVLQLQRRWVKPHPTGIYREIGVRCFGKGIFHKNPVEGSVLGNKRVLRIEPGDLVFNNVFAWEGAVAVAGASESGMIGSHRFVTYRVNPNTATAEFLKLFFTTPVGLDILLKASPGSAGRNKTLGLDRFIAQSVPLPPLPEQRRIVARIGELAAQIHEARALRRQAAEDADALCVAAVAHRLATAGGTRMLGETESCEIICGQHLNAEDQAESGIPYMTGPADFGERAAVPSRFARFARALAKPGDVLLTVKGAGVGKANLAPETPSAIGRQLYALRPKPDRIDQVFLFYAVQDGIRHFRDAMTATTVPGIAKNNVEELRLPLPPLPEQRRIVAELDALQAQVDALKRLQAETAAELDALLPAILDKAFKGEL